MQCAKADPRGGGLSRFKKEDLAVRALLTGSGRIITGLHNDYVVQPSDITVTRVEDFIADLDRTARRPFVSQGSIERDMSNWVNGVIRWIVNNAKAQPNR
jgi:hypothetical protein